MKEDQGVAASPPGHSDAVLLRAYRYIMDEAEARNFDPPVPCDLVADIEAALGGVDA